MAKKSEYSRGQWARNKSDRIKRQEAQWGGKDRIKKMNNFKTSKMESVAGKNETYRTRVDSRGRTYIMDLGQDAPSGYYSDGSRYYKLKRNVRLSSESSRKQKASWFANQAEILGRDVNKRGGYLDHAGRNGMIAGMGNGVAEVNFRKTQDARKMMDNTEAYYHGAHAHKKSRYIFKIGQDGREA